MFFAPTPRGKQIPLDAEPVPDGNIALVDGVATPIPKGAEIDVPRFKSHFATCPFARRFSKPKRD